MADVVKYGIQIPNRIFVGGIAFNTEEKELREFFEKYGKVKDCKIVADKDGFSRGFGFVTFESKQEATQTQKLGTVFFNQKKLNLGPAIRQKGVVFNGAQEAANEPVTSAGVYIHPSGYCYTVAPNGVWYFHSNGSSGEEVPASMQTATPSTQTQQISTTHVPLTKPTTPTPHVQHTFHNQAPQPAVPMTIVPADPNNVPQNYPMNGHYILPPNVSIINPNTPETPRHFVPESSFMPCYVSQPQPLQPMNAYPITSPPPPPPPPHQMHHGPPAVHVFRGTYPAPAIQNAPRAEIYQVLTSPYDSSIIEQGPFIQTNNRTFPSNMMKPLMRPAGPIKRVTAELPPNYPILRSYELLNHTPNGHRAFTSSNGSTPSSSLSSSLESDHDPKDESK